MSKLPWRLSYWSWTWFTDGWTKSRSMSGMPSKAIRKCATQIFGGQVSGWRNTGDARYPWRCSTKTGYVWWICCLVECHPLILFSGKWLAYFFLNTYSMWRPQSWPLKIAAMLKCGPRLWILESFAWTLTKNTPLAIRCEVIMHFELVKEYVIFFRFGEIWAFWAIDWLRPIAT